MAEGREGAPIGVRASFSPAKLVEQVNQVRLVGGQQPKIEGKNLGASVEEGSENKKGPEGGLKAPLPEHLAERARRAADSGFTPETPFGPDPNAAAAQARRELLSPREPIGMADSSQANSEAGDNQASREPKARRIRKFDEKHPDYEEWEDAINRGDDVEADEIKKRAEARIKLDTLLEPKTADEEKLEVVVQGAEGSNSQIDVYTYAQRDRVALLVERLESLGDAPTEEVYRNIVQEINPRFDTSRSSDAAALRDRAAYLMTLELSSTLYSPRQIEVIVSRLGLTSEGEAKVMESIYKEWEEYVEGYKGASQSDYADKLLLSKLIEEDEGYKKWKEKSETPELSQAPTERTPAQKGTEQLLGLLKEESKEFYSIEDLRDALLKIPVLGEKTRAKLSEADLRNVITYLSLQMRGGRLDAENGEFWARIDPKVRSLLIGENSLLKKADPDMVERAEASLKRYVFNQETAPKTKTELEHDRELGVIKFNIDGSLHSLGELRRDFESWLYTNNTDSQDERLKSLKELPFCKALLMDSQSLEELIMLNVQNLRYRPDQISYLLRGAGIDNGQRKSIMEGLYENIQQLETRPTYKSYASLISQTEGYREWKKQPSVRHDNPAEQRGEDRALELAEGIIQNYLEFAKANKEDFAGRSIQLQAAADNLFRSGLSVDQVYKKLESTSGLESGDLHALTYRYNSNVVDFGEPVQLEQALRNSTFASWYGLDERFRRENIQEAEKKCAAGVLNKNGRMEVVQDLVLGRVTEQEFTKVLLEAAPQDKAAIANEFYKRIRRGSSEFTWVRQWRSNPDYQKWEKSKFSIKELGKGVLSSVKGTLLSKRGQKNTRPVEAPRFPRGDEPRVDENTAFVPALPIDFKPDAEGAAGAAIVRGNEAVIQSARERFNRGLEWAVNSTDAEKAAGGLLFSARGLLEATKSDMQDKRAADILSKSPDLQIETAVAIQGAIVEADQRDSIDEIKEWVQVAKILGLDTVPAVRTELANVLKLYPEIDVNLTEIGS